MAAVPEPIVLVPGKSREQALQLRETGPLARVVVEGLEVWALTHDRELREALIDPRFRRNWRTWRALNEGEVATDHPVAAMVYLDNMLTVDGEAHRRMRSPVAQAFTPRRVELLRPRVTEIVNALLDQLAERDGTVDFKTEFAYPLSMRVFSALFGIPERDHGRMQQMVNTAFSPSSPEEVRAMREELDAFLDELIEDKRRSPGEDLTSALVTATDEEHKLSDAELRDTLWLLVTAGFETTSSALANAVQTLLTHPDQLAHLRSGSIAWEDAIEEVLRQSSSVATLPFLFAAEDVQIGDRTIRAGEPVLLAYLAANLDVERYGEDAAEFDATQSRPRHLAFGHGPHTCLGAALARLEMEVALTTLFTEFPEVSLAEGEAPRLESVFIHAPAALPIRLGPRRTAA